MFLAKRTGRAKGYVGASADVPNRETRHGQCKTPLLRQGHDTGMPETLLKDVHKRLVFVVE